MSEPDPNATTPARECPSGFCDGSGLRYWTGRDYAGSRTEESSVCLACKRRDEEEKSSR